MRHLTTMYFSNASKKDELLKLAFCQYLLSQQLSQNQPLSLPMMGLLAVTTARAHLGCEMAVTELTLEMGRLTWDRPFQLLILGQKPMKE